MERRIEGGLLQMKCSGFRDRHLNVFINYASNGRDNDGEHLENNITKALINTFESLPCRCIKEVCEKLFNIFDLPDTFSCEYYLQWKSTNENIKKTILSIPIANRKLLAFSPTGKSWGFEGSDTKDYDKLKENIEEYYRKNEPNLSAEMRSKKVKYQLSEIKKVHDNNSIPDGLMIIKNKSDAIYAIAMENKKYDLNPYQLNNHIEKSLEIYEQEDKKYALIFKKYEDITESLKEIKTYMTDSFIEYMTILGYCKPVNFEESCNAEEGLRHLLTIHFGKDILERIKDSYNYKMRKINENNETIETYIDLRSSDTCRLSVNYPFLSEINLVFRKEKVFISLAFASMQNSAKEMYSILDPERFKCIPDDMKAKKSFHLMYYRGKNIRQSYINDEIDNRSIYEYVKYWKENVNLIEKTKEKQPRDSLKLYEKMKRDGIINDYNDIDTFLEGKVNDVLVVPELLFEPEWTYEEIGEMGEENFIKEIKGKINYALSLFDLPVKS